MKAATIVRERPRSETERSAGRQPLHVMGEDIFRSVLIRERKRSDRSNRPFVLLVLDMPADGRWWRHAIEALAVVRRGTDIVGWLRHQHSLALMMPCGEGRTESGARAVEDAVRCELAKRLDAATLNLVSIGLHTHAGRHAAGDSGAASVDSLLVVLASRQAPSAVVLAKRALDIVGSLALLVFLAPVFLIVAAIVKLTSPGPVFFSQTRVGERARPFRMLKFRTMRSDADDRLHREYVSSLIAAEAQGSGGGGVMFKMTNDPRVTPIGRVLRKTSLDELPQFINVLFGTMSLVGPRPPIPYEVEQYKAWHQRRVLDAKPGITGLWQVTGRSRTTFDEMVRLDLRYARTCSIWTDIKILLATPRAVLSGKGAC